MRVYDDHHNRYKISRYFDRSSYLRSPQAVRRAGESAAILAKLILEGVGAVRNFDADNTRCDSNPGWHPSTTHASSILFLLALVSVALALQAINLLHQIMAWFQCAWNRRLSRSKGAPDLPTFDYRYFTTHGSCAPQYFCPSIVVFPREQGHPCISP